LSQRTLEGEIAGLETLDMTSGLLGMQAEIHEWADVNLDASAYRKVTVRGSFHALPFKDDAFMKVLFDPPHLLNVVGTLLATVNNINGLGPGLAGMKYGCFRNVDQLRKALYAGSREAYRVLKSGGVMVFKWSDAEKSFHWAQATIDRRFEIENFRLMRSKAGTRNNTFLAWYRKR